MGKLYEIALVVWLPLAFWLLVGWRVPDRGLKAFLFWRR